VSRPRVLVVEDEKKTAASLQLYLENAGFDVRIAGTGSAGLREARAGGYALVLLDLMLPELDGLAVCRALRAESDVPVIVLTARSTEEDKLRGLRVGADDYVTKPFSPREVVARVRAVLRRAAPERAADRGAIRTRRIRLDLDRREAAISGRAVQLTRAEFDLLAAFVRAPGRAFSRQELLERAFGPEYEALERTLDAHVMRLRRKIEPDARRPSLIQTVFGVGYKLADTDE
jgi:DNA-binding response OmpR family regulator